jgi:antirestriction protein ArdC
MLWYEGLSKGYTSNAWMTYNQAKALGAQVRKGEKATCVIFWKVSKYKKNDEEKKSFLLRYYNVFNASQIDGLPEKAVAAIPDGVELAKPEEVVKAWETKPAIKHGGTQAFYSPSFDYVNMPKRGTFHTPEGYYKTLFHELVHSTGHTSRLDRGFGTSYGTEAYSKEELVAEIGASFLSATCGIDTRETDDNSVAYIQSWMKKLQADPKLIMQAASAAQKAANMILNKKASYEKTEDGDDAISDDVEVAA